ncbi:MAG: ATPase domain-containing protein [Candidatus Thorarchaeota archaeon]
MNGRVSSGIEGLDLLLGGGYLPGRTVVISGGPGTGKSVISWQFLFDGSHHGERGVLMSLDQSSESILADMRSFRNFPEEEYRRGSIKILSGAITVVATPGGYEYVISFEEAGQREKPLSVERLASYLVDAITRTGARRVVIDGLGPLLEMADNRFEMRQTVYSFLRQVRSRDTTVIVTHEMRSGGVGDDLPHFMADGVIRLDMTQYGGEYVRVLQVVKMRGTGHVMKPVLFKIGTDGVQVFPETKIADR